MKLLLTTIMCSIGTIFFMNTYAQKLLIGTYTHNKLSKGIYIYAFDTTTGKASPVSHVNTNNPSFLVADKNNAFVYCVNEENKNGTVSAFSYNPGNNSLTFVNSEDSNGSDPCYISLDRTGKWLFVGNYSSGSLTVYPILSDGRIGPRHQFIQHKGSSINKSRQENAHVHCTYISEDNKTLFVPDLGLDKVIVYPFNAQTGFLDTKNQSVISVKPGGGPRHIIFTRKGTFGYLIEELSGSVDVIQKRKDGYTIIQTVNRLPAEQDGAGADIHLSPDERFLYVSQRSNSTIQIFSVDPQNGKLSFIGEQATLGDFPRNFTIHPSGKFLLAANQKSNDITIFRIDSNTGLLQDTGARIEVGAPVCLQWIDGH